MRWMNIKRTAKAAAALVAFAACGQAVDNRGEDLGDIRGIEELGSPNLTALASGDAVFNAKTGVMAVTLQASESLVQVSKRASDSAILLNGVPVVDTLGATIASATGLKRLNLIVGADNTTVIFDYYNGTFNAGIKAVSPALFGTAGTLVTFGAHTGCSFKVRGTSSADTFYVGQDTIGANPNVLISFSAANPDIEVSATTMPSLGFNLGNGNDAFDAFSAKGGTLHPLSFPVSVHGGVGNDTLIGGTGADSLFGDEGVNVIDESLLSTAHTADKLYGLTTPVSTGATGANTTTVTYATWAGAAGVTVKIAHLATALIGGVTDNVDDTVTAVIGSPKNDTIACSQLTDTPCYVQGMAGDDTLSPGLSTINTHYMFGGDGNDTFVMTQVVNHASLAGGNIADIATVKNAFVDTVDYSTAISALSSLATTISMNGTAPATCAIATSVTTPPCPGIADTVPSGFVGSAHTDIRNDVTVAKCPTGSFSAGVVCTVKANSSGDTIFSGFGSDRLTGGTGDDIFVLANFNASATYTAATATKVVTGGGGNDTADFSAYTGASTIHLDCALGTCANSGSPFGVTAADVAAAASAVTAATGETTDVATLNAAFAALATPTADDNAVHSAALSANTAVQAAVTAYSAAVATPNATTVAALTAAVSSASSATASLATADATRTTGNAGVLADARAVQADAANIVSVVSVYVNVSEGISLVNVNNTVCPSNGMAVGVSACAVTSNGNSDVIDFSGDGAVAGSSLTCNSSNVIVAHATGLTPNCGI
jgi:Ca2+-binding RTX toxin-like protein